MDKGAKDKSDLSEHMSKFLNNNPNVSHQTRQLLELHSLQLRLKQQHDKEQHMLEKSFHEKLAHFYKQRDQVVNPPTESKSTAPNRGSVVSRSGANHTSGGSSKGIPGFWLQAMKNHQLINSEITAADEGLLKHLTNIRLGYPNKPGFQLFFDFKENEYFTDRTLVKSFEYEVDEEDFARDLTIAKAPGCEIHWKEGKNVTEGALLSEDHEALATVLVPSFFDFFDTPEEEDEEDDDEDGDEDEDEEEDGEDEDEDDAEDDNSDGSSLFESALEHDFGIGEEFKEKIIPYTLHWYTGEAAEAENDYEDEDGES